MQGKPTKPFTIITDSCCSLNAAEIKELCIVVLIKYKIDSEKYKDLWEAEKYTIDHENRKIIMTMFNSGEKKEYNY